MKTVQNGTIHTMISKTKSLYIIVVICLCMIAPNSFPLHQEVTGSKFD